MGDSADLILVAHRDVDPDYLDHNMDHNAEDSPKNGGTEGKGSRPYQRPPVRFLRKSNRSKHISLDNESDNGPTMNRQFSLSGKNKGPGNKQWVHPADALLKGHIVYNVKFLGQVEVETPKGTDVVREAIRKMKFNKHLKKAEGTKPPKVELTISVDGVTIQDPKIKMIQHQHSLHRISYCADDKSDKRMFTFIAKQAETNKHMCYVFDSEKCAEEITLTIGQAFDLAYRKFLETSSKDMDHKKQFLLLQKKVQQLTKENLDLKARVADLERLIDPKVLNNFDKQRNNGETTRREPVVGRKLENLVLEDHTATPPSSTPYTNGALSRPTGGATPSGVPALAPPPPVPSRSHHGTPNQKTATGNSPGIDLFGATPFTAEVTSPTSPTASKLPPPLTSPTSPPATAQFNSSNPFRPATGSGDPFGMPAFTPPQVSAQDLDQQIQNVDQELMDLQTGFSQGLSMGTEDFSLEDLDPLNQK